MAALAETLVSLALVVPVVLLVRGLGWPAALEQVARTVISPLLAVTAAMGVLAPLLLIHQRQVTAVLVAMAGV